jgi:hypothetical protein
MTCSNVCNTHTCAYPVYEVSLPVATGSGVPVDQIVQVVGALLEHLMTSSPSASTDGKSGGRPGRPQARRKRRAAASEDAARAADPTAPASQVHTLADDA